MKATEARKTANEYLLNEDKWSYNKVMSKIQGAAKKGQFSVTIYDNVSKVVVFKIQGEGYTVSEYHPFMPSRDEYSLTIKW